MSTSITYIYTLTDPLTDLVRYVGKSDSPNRRLKEHIRKCDLKRTHKDNWVSSLLKDNVKPKLDVIDVVLVSEWCFWESFWISQYRTWGFNLVNMSEGGEGGNHGPLVNHKISLSKMGFKHSDESKSKMSTNSMGIKPPKTVREKMSKKHMGNQYAKGFKHSDEFKKRMSEDFSGEKNPMYGKKHTEETVNKIKNKLSKINMGGEYNPFYGKKHSDGTKEKMSVKVIKYSLDGELLCIYNSMTIASKENNISQSLISLVCSGKRKTTGGYIWKKN